MMADMDYKGIIGGMGGLFANVREGGPWKTAVRLRLGLGCQ